MDRPLDDRVQPLLHVLFRHVDPDIGIDAELQRLIILVEQGRRRETDRPAVGQFRVEGHAAATARAIAHNHRVGHLAHPLHEIVSGAIALPVGQDHDRPQPAHPLGRLHINRIRLREIIMPLACLVLDITGQRLLVGETGGDTLTVREQATAVITDIKDQSLAILEGEQDIIEAILAR